MLAQLPIPIIAVVGSRKSGKTTTVEVIVRELTKKGYRIASAKSIHEPNFTIDAKGKDTWRHAQAGAQTTVGVSTNELATIKKIDTSKYTLNDITQNCEDNIDIIILEGFRNLIAQDQTVPKVVTAKNKEEIREAQRTIKPILAFTGPIQKSEATAPNIPYVDIQTEPRKLTEIIENRVGPIVQKRRELKQALNIKINGKMVPLNPYVQTVTRNVLFAIVSTLKGVSIKKNENVQITLTSPSKAG
jgi:molybdopterin-guanine dinucleotide biosynthesis protein MobB